MTPGSRGQALALAAFAIHALSAWPVRLHWCVDLARDVGPGADVVIDPSDPMKGETLWGTYLQRFRTALDAQPHGPFRCRLALSVRYTTPTSQRLLLITFHIPWGVNLCLLGRAGPPVGAWRVMFDPSKGNGGLPDGEQAPLPVSFWYDGIPF